MHEINTAAEAITAAADPDANIIFGATISPEVEGEIIITVVATGFDSSYFANRKTAPTIETPPTQNIIEQTSVEQDTTYTDTTSIDNSPNLNKMSEKEMSGIDMEIHDTAEHNEAHADFTNDEPLTNMWTDIDSSKDKKQDYPSAPPFQTPIVSSHEEDELEKPSFLRRLTRRRQKADDKKPENDV